MVYRHIYGVGWFGSVEGWYVNVVQVPDASQFHHYYSCVLFVVKC